MTEDEDLTRRIGAMARAHGQSRASCPWSGDRARLWLEGYDGAVSPADLVKAFPSGGPLLGGR